MTKREIKQFASNRYQTLYTMRKVYTDLLFQTIEDIFKVHQGESFHFENPEDCVIANPYDRDETAMLTMAYHNGSEVRVRVMNEEGTTDEFNINRLDNDQLFGLATSLSQSTAMSSLGQRGEWKANA